ncbi:AraC family transcriptional regulator [Spirosoma endophyticum]|uniref:Transcriptional regulator, AraC family n=1 Tax=Spirosoma endophyticum TaxID=662367 RepID=A0A1I1V4Q8_9BACT|nr:AraC family transcriptional regulator [Spirosoma endophyticum]SFD78017.1 transcriptional regulator, AraC family [Spirosoma endophyticum]
MKVLEYTPPVPKEDSVVVDEDILPNFYDYFHRHKQLQLTLIIKGEGTLMAGNYSQTFKPGDIYILGVNQPHIFKSAPTHFANPQKGNSHAIHVYFDQDRIPNAFFSLPEMESISNFLASTQNGFQLPSEYAGYVTKILLKLRNKSNLDRLLHILKLFHYFSQEVRGWKSLGSGFANTSLSDYEGLRMNDVFQYTLEHYAENITLNRIAEIANITPHAFCKYFKKHTRKTYNTFLNEIRINEACKKIINSHYDGISTIAYSTGFNSATNFNRVFRKTTGMSPRDYIREYKSKVGHWANS